MRLKFSPNVFAVFEKRIIIYCEFWWLCTTSAVFADKHELACQNIGISCRLKLTVIEQVFFRSVEGNLWRHQTKPKKKNLEECGFTNMALFLSLFLFLMNHQQWNSSVDNIEQRPTEHWMRQCPDSDEMS